MKDVLVRTTTTVLMLYCCMLDTHAQNIILFCAFRVESSTTHSLLNTHHKTWKVILHIQQYSCRKQVITHLLANKVSVWSWERSRLGAAPVSLVKTDIFYNRICEYSR